jgi:hypothetical protein
MEGRGGDTVWLSDMGQVLFFFRFWNHESRNRGQYGIMLKFYNPALYISVTFSFQCPEIWAAPLRYHS